MRIVGSIEDSVRGGRRLVYDAAGNKFRGHAEYFFQSGADEPPGPQAFLVHQAPGWELAQHFHLQHQIQVVVAGGGRMGRHALAPLTVHYASPEAAYGPLVAGPEGLTYFTLRVRTDRGAWHLPESRAMMRTDLRKEQVSGQASPGALPPGGATLIAPRADGLGAWAHIVPRGGLWHCDAPVSPAGRFHVVTGGSFELDGAVLPLHACVYWREPGAAPVFKALEEGSELVVVQFPAAALTHEVAADRVAQAPQQKSVAERPA